MPFLSRLLAWLRRNPTARADGLELAALAARARADRLDERGRQQAALRARDRAALLEARALQLRRSAGPVRNTVPIPPPPPARR